MEDGDWKASRPSMNSSFEAVSKQKYLTTLTAHNPGRSSQYVYNETMPEWCSKDWHQPGFTRARRWLINNLLKFTMYIVTPINKYLDGSMKITKLLNLSYSPQDPHLLLKPCQHYHPPVELHAIIPIHLCHHKPSRDCGKLTRTLCVQH